MGDVLGKRPAALLFATPALCHSRTCGPVTDLAVQLEDEYAERMTFIHHEIYVGNDPNKGLRPQLRAFGLETEPSLLTFDREGRSRPGSKARSGSKPSEGRRWRRCAE